MGAFAFMKTKKFIIIATVVVVAIVVGVTLGVVLSRRDNTEESTVLRFPEDFLFGAASASYQIEGAWNADGKGASIWDIATHNDPSFIDDQSNGDIAANSYEFYKEDVRILKETGVNFYRFSISWPRVLPDGDISSRNEIGLQYYDNLINELIANDIEPMVTMYHWDLPQYLQILGGWANPIIIDYFEQYANLLFDRYGNRVKYWTTFNEPISFCEFGYGIGTHAPRIISPGVGDYMCGYHVLLSHAKAYHLYKNEYYERFNGEIGIALYSPFAFPRTEGLLEDIKAADDIIEFWFGWFANPIFSETGGFPAVMIENINRNSLDEGRKWSRLPEFTDEQKANVKGTADFMGLNYYTSHYAEPSSETSLIGFDKDLSVRTSVNASWPVSASSWLRDVPQGLRGLLNWIKERYDNPKVIITENGWSDDGSTTEDDERIHYLEGHLRAIALSILEDDCNVKGHTTWSIIDNFEWTNGYTKRFGIYQVNFTSPTKERTPKKSVDVLMNVIKSRSISVEEVESEDTTIQPTESTSTTTESTTTPEPEVDPNTYVFPDDFKFGAASAAYQIEGAWNVDGKGVSIWDVATHSVPSFIADQSNGDIAANSYELYKEDVRILKETGVNFYRFSISWPRVLTDGDISSRNEIGLQYYDNLINELIANDIEPMVTMYHWDLPQYLQMLGGWTNPIIIDYFKEYARLLFNRYGDRIKNWMTFNEPGIFCQLGYGVAVHAPRIRSSGIADYLCGHHVLLANAEVYHLYRNEYFDRFQGQVGIVLESGFSWPKSFTVENIKAAERSMEFGLGWFAKPIFSEVGGYPDIMIENINRNSINEGRTRSRLPVFSDEEKEFIKGTADFMGLNYYTSNYVADADYSNLEYTAAFIDESIESSVDPSWPAAASTRIRDIPKGLRDLLNWIKNKYNNPVVIIAENGWSDNGSTLNDESRIHYLKGHLLAVAKAIADDGCNVKGHTTWSIMDNFEWGQGYTEKFGIYYVDFDSPNRERTAKASVDSLRQIFTTKTISLMETPSKFPDYFLFGAASAAYQIEGAWNTDGKGPSIWDIVSHEHSDQIADGSTGDVAANSYELYAEDVRILKETGVNFYRFSISWSRVLTDGDISSRNELGLQYYDNLINELIANDIVPMVTMYHWDLPYYLHMLGGWTNPIIVDYFEQYAKLLFDRYGDRIKYWNTFNEPIIFCEYGYGNGVHAPLIESPGIGDYLCGHHVLLANARVYHLYKNEYFERYGGLVGFVVNSGHTWPRDENNPEHVAAAERSIQFWLGWYAHPIFGDTGDYPEIMIDIVNNNSMVEGRQWSRLPTFTDEERELNKGSADFLGLNYYTSNYAEPTNDLSWTPNPSFYRDQNIHSTSDPAWPVAESNWLRSVPRGLRDLLNWIKERYNNPYVLITENGWSDDGTSLNDFERIDYLRGHFDAVLQAIDDGCNVMGHTTWSIIDNFEWMEGYTERFGIYSVNFTSENKERTPKLSVDFLSDLFETRKLT